METARITDQKVELTDDVKMELDQKQKILLEHIAEQPEITVTWFQADERKAGGEYVTSVGHLKRIDEVQRILCMTNGRKISLDDIIEIQTEWSRNDLFPG